MQTAPPAERLSEDPPVGIRKEVCGPCCAQASLPFVGPPPFPSPPPVPAALTPSELSLLTDALELSLGRAEVANALRQHEVENGKATAAGSPSSGGNRSTSTTWFGRAGPICILPTPFAAASGSTGADGTGTLTQQVCRVVVVVDQRDALVACIPMIVYWRT